MALVYSRNTHNFSSLSKARPSGLQAINLSIYHRCLWLRRCGILRCLSEAWPYSYPTLVGESHAAPCIPRSCTIPIPHGLLGLELKENAIGVPRHCWVQWRISVLRTSVPSICHDVWLYVGAIELDNNIVYVLHSRPCPGVLGCFFSCSIFHKDGIWHRLVCPIV